MVGFRRKLRNRKNPDPEDNSSVTEEEPLSVTRLNGGTEFVRRVIFLAEHNLVLAASNDLAVRVYDLDTTGEPPAVFKRHTGSVNDVVQLVNDVVASVGDDMRLLTWRATTAELVGEWEHSAVLSSVAKLSESMIVVGDLNDNVTVLSHQSASQFQVYRRLDNPHFALVSHIVVHGDLFVTCSNDKTAKVWDTNSLALRATLPHDYWVLSANVSDKYIVTAGYCPKISVFRNAPDYNLLFDLPLSEPEFLIGQVAFLNDDVVAVPSGRYLYFISLPTKSVLSRVRTDYYVISFDEFSDGRIAVGGKEGYCATKSVLSRARTDNLVASFVVLSDGRIAVGGRFGYCAIITPPKSVQDAVDDCVASIAAARVPPLHAAWRAVQNRYLTLAEACSTVITSDNCSASLEEWCVAHHLLMEAVKCGEIPASRDHGNSIAHWHWVLYQHCAKLAMGEKCMNFVTARFREAEDAGVIAKGQIESVINTIGIRRDMDADNRFLVHATYQLFVRQAEMDVRLRQVLHYQRVQQVTAVLNALIGCIPVAGAIVTNVLSGGASILKEMDVCGLVESVLGIGKEAFGVFASDRLVDRVLQRGNAVLSVDEWKNVPAEKKKVVEDAASNLGLTIDELREKLLLVGAMQSGEDEKPSEQVIIQEVDEHTTIQGMLSTQDDTNGGASLSMDVASVGGAGLSATGMATTASVNRDEGMLSVLKQWEATGVSKDVVGPLETFEAAACFAAFILNYEAEGGETYSNLTEMMRQLFKKKRIYGASFVEADEEERAVLVDVLMAALEDVTDEDALVLTKMWVKKFIRLASQ